MTDKKEGIYEAKFHQENSTVPFAVAQNSQIMMHVKGESMKKVRQMD